MGERLRERTTNVESRHWEGEWTPSQLVAPSSDSGADTS
ncbi:MAG: hypothetical protein ACI8W3_002166, partial [Myxococcota bacterium]